MSDVDIELFSIKDPRPLTAKAKPANDNEFEDMFHIIDDHEMDQPSFETENIFEAKLHKQISEGNSSAEIERSTSSEEKSAGEKRGNNKVSSSNTLTPYQKRKVRKKDGKQKRRVFKRLTAGSSTSSISYQSNVKFEDNNHKLDKSNGGGHPTKNMGGKERTVKRKTSLLRGKHHSEQKQTTSPSNKAQHKTYQKDTESSLSPTSQSSQSQMEINKTLKIKEKRKPNLEHIAKLAETSTGCSNPQHVHGDRKNSLVVMEEINQDLESAMDHDSCEVMEVCESGDRKICNDYLNDTADVGEENVAHSQDSSNGSENNEAAGPMMDEVPIETDITKIESPDSRPRVRLTNLSLSMPNTRDGKRSDDEDTHSHSTWLLDCRNIWSNNKLKGHYQKMYQNSEFRDRSFQNVRQQVDINNKPVKTNTRFMQGMKNNGPRGCIMRTVKQGSFVLLGTVKTIKDDRDRLSLNF